MIWLTDIMWFWDEFNRDVVSVCVCVFLVSEDILMGLHNFNGRFEA